MNSDKRSTIVLICQHFYPEMLSTGLFITELAVGLAEKGLKIRVFTARPSYADRDSAEALPNRAIYENVEILRVPAIGDPKGGILSRTLFSLTYLLSTMWQLLRQPNLGGVINTTNPPFIGLAAVLAKWLKKAPYITIVHDIYPDIVVRAGILKPNSPIVAIWEQLTRLILNQSSAVTVLGRDMAEIIGKKLSPANEKEMILAPNWANETRMIIPDRADNPFIATHQLQNRFVVQYSGRMGRTHNLEPLIESAELLRDTPVLIQLIGDGAKRPLLEKMVQERQLNNVQFLPYQPIETLVNSLSAADLAVVCLEEKFVGLSVPSKSYGVMACARPILGFLPRRSEIGRVIEEEQCGLLLENPTGSEVAQAIRTLIENRDLCQKMGENGRKAFLAKYSLRASIERYEKLIGRFFDLQK